MHVTRIESAKSYEAPLHVDVSSLRLQGFDASPAQNCWVGLSHFLPGGGVEKSGSPLEKIYVAVSGEITVITDTEEVTLTAMDSCYLAPGEAREIVNRTNMPASMLVIMPYPREDPTEGK